jgi:site-specific DNA-methyltransferase (adenine-specific)
VKADSAFFDLAAGGIDGMGVDFARVVGEIKPGAHLLALSPIATHHCHTIQVEDAGFEVRDTVAWVFDSGGQTPEMLMVTVARKPLEGTVAANVLEHGTGALNVDGCRVGTGDRRMCGTTDKSGETSIVLGARTETRTEAGRWPANLIHDGSDEVVGLFPQTVSGGDFKQGMVQHSRTYNVAEGVETERVRDAYERDNGGSAARFFYTAPCLDSLITYLLKLITKPNGTVLTNCNKEKLPNDYNYIGQEL